MCVQEVKEMFNEIYLLYQKYEKNPMGQLLFQQLPTKPIKESYTILQEVLNFYEKYSKVRLEDWENISKESIQLLKEFKQENFMKELLLMILSSLEEESKQYLKRKRL